MGKELNEDLYINHRSYRNAEFIKSLNDKELKDYYDCFQHHNHFKKTCRCKTEAERVHDQDKDCPCRCASAQEKHFCTPINGICDCQNRLVICENYPDSFTSKGSQLDSLNKKIYELRKSKALLKRTMRDLDSCIVPDERPMPDGLDEVERFYRRSKSFLGSSIKVTSLSKNLPRADIVAGKYETTCSWAKEDLPPYASALFDSTHLERGHTFVDRELFEKLEKLKAPPKKDPPKPDPPVTRSTMYLLKNK
jgi:hypothetical protein